MIITPEAVAIQANPDAVEASPALDSPVPTPTRESQILAPLPEANHNIATPSPLGSLIPSAPSYTPSPVATVTIPDADEPFSTSTAVPDTPFSADGGVIGFTITASSSGKKLATGTVAAIVVACVFGVMLFVLAGWVGWKRRQLQRKRRGEAERAGRAVEEGRIAEMEKEAMKEANMEASGQQNTATEKKSEKWDSVGFQ